MRSIPAHRLSRSNAPARRSRVTPSSPLRVLFVNGNLGGHVTMHQHLERGLRGHEDVAASFLSVDRAGLAREVLAARIPLLNRLDLDLKQLRFQIGVGVWVRSRLRGRLGQFDVLHIYPHDVGLLCARFVRQMPTVVSLDAPNSESFLLLPYRRPTRWTPRILRLSMRLEQRLFRAATLIVAQSEWAARALERDYGIDRAKIRVIRFGIAQPPEIAPAATEGVPQITFVGRTMGRKGGWRLLDVFGIGFANSAA